MCFVNQSLASLPKTFGVKELKKGYFPYLFLTEGTMDYVGPYPPPSDFCVSQMTVPKRKDFFEWYDQVKDGIFDMQKELAEYGESDVDILARCMLEFDKLLNELSQGIRPLTHAISIAQLCNNIWRKNFMEPFSVAIIPPGGYKSGDRISKTAQEWLAWWGYKNDVRIQHGRNGREFPIGKYKVDGLVDDGSGRVLEFNG